MPDPSDPVNPEPSAPPRNLAVLFADVTGSTKLYETLGDAEALATVDRCLALVAQVCRDFGGRIVKSIGDEMMLTFVDADGAARAARDILARVCELRTSNGAPLSMHVGFHYGPVIEDQGDVFGDSVNLAKRMAQLAPGGQIFTTAETTEALSQHLRAKTRDLDSLNVKGMVRDVGIYELLWRESTEDLTALSPRLVVRTQRVRITHGERTIELGETTPAHTLGRDAGNDIVVSDRKASRMHARIERRRDKFVLIDHSSNGTYVTVAGEPEIMLRREEWTMRGSGHFSFGHPYEDDPAEVLQFDCLD
ncbi:MAG TPA: adenylate/guanylate cyclase domain-containing protein [Casimicrobiaceae bacterium]|nr:adenylate/guanylate cyclase domain-containing protein [Casimicrobiaceae bacterium]